MLQLLVVLGLISGAWYLLIVRPQKEQHGRHQSLVGNLSVGAHVMTVGGIYGRVQAIEGSTVVIELAPGMVTRVAVDGIARLVRDAEAPLPQHPAQATMAAPEQQVRQHEMNGSPHQHPQPEQQQWQQYAPPQPPVVMQQPAPVQPQHVMGYQQPAPPAPGVAPQQVYQHQPAPVQVAPPAPEPAHTWNLPAPPQLALQPRAPFGEHVQPVATAQPQPQPVYQHQPVPVAMPQYHQQPQQVVQQAPPPQQYQYAPVTAPQPAVYAQHVPVAPQPQQYVAAQPAPVTQPPASAYPQPMVHAHMQHPAAMHELPHQQDHAHGPEAPRRRSAAPQGMGSAIRLDDPQIAEAMGRARSERAELAEEYRRLTAPLVGDDHAIVQQPQQLVDPTMVMPQVQVAGAPQQLFVQAPAPAMAQQYPQPVVLPDATAAMPRPGIINAPQPQVMTPQPPAPAQPAAFQRHAPYAPQAQAEPVPAG